MVVTCAKFGLLAVASFTESSVMHTAEWVTGETVIVMSVMICFLGSTLSITMVELSVELSLSPLIVVHSVVQNF